MSNNGYRIIAAALLGASGLVVAACTAKSDAQLTVTTATAAEGIVTRSVEFSGVFAPNQTANVFSELGGRAIKVTAQVGDRVTAGQLLVQIDTRQLQAQLAEAEAAEQAVEDQAAQAQLAVQTAKTNLELAQVSFDRTAALYKTQAVSKNELDDVQNKLDLARSAHQNAQQQYDLLVGSGLAQAKARVDLMNVQLSNSLIDSPISGVVTNRNVNPGELVAMTMPVMTIADTATLKLQGTVSQDVVPLLSIGQTVSVGVDGMNGVAFPGTVSQIGPVAAATGQYFPVVVNVANDGRILAGMTAIASFSVRSPEGIVIPTSAVQRDGSDFYAYVVRDGSVVRVKLRLGLRSSTEALVVDGLVPGDTVATSNLGLLANGTAVTVTK